MKIKFIVCTLLLLISAVSSFAEVLMPIDGMVTSFTMTQVSVQDDSGDTYLVTRDSVGASEFERLKKMQGKYVTLHVLGGRTKIQDAVTKKSTTLTKAMQK